MMLVVPVVTRWNSIYMAMKKLNDIIVKSKDKLKSLFDKLGVNYLSVDEIQFISEYVQTMKPFAMALDILQDEKMSTWVFCCQLSVFFRTIWKQNV